MIYPSHQAQMTRPGQLYHSVFVGQLIVVMFEVFCTRCVKLIVCTLALSRFLSGVFGTWRGAIAPTAYYSKSMDVYCVKHARRVQ